MFVLSFSGLEDDVIVFSTTSGNGVAMRVQSVSLESLDSIHIQ